MRVCWRGFTLVELLVTIAVAGVLVAAAVPQFQSMVRRQQMASVANDMIMSINFARSEATRVGGGVQMQAVNATNNGNEWGPGWQIVGPTGTVLQSFIGATGGMTINGTDGVNVVTFNGRGLPNLTVQMDMCNPGSGVRIAMSAVGRPATSDLTSSTCP